MREFADRRLGKNVVVAKDTPGFIANHVAMHGLVRIFEALASGAYTVEEIDAITGPAIGRPKSATFRTVDIAGLDILVHVANDLAARLPARTRLAVPLSAVRARDARARLDRREGRTRVLRAQEERRRRDATSGRSIRRTMEYRPRQPVTLPSLDAARRCRCPSACASSFRERIASASFFRATLPPPLQYTAEVAPEIAHSIDDVDRAMRWGYGWPLGPFELADAIGLDDQPYRSLAARDRRAAELEILRSARDRKPVVASNAGASLIDLGDGVLAVSLHSKMNAIGGDALEMLQRGVREASARTSRRSSSRPKGRISPSAPT